MISKKIFSADGTTTRFLPDFLVRSEQFTRPYVYIYDPLLNPDGSEDQLQNGSTLQADWSWPDNLWKRGDDVAQSDDITTADKWQIVDNSIVYYVAPPSGTTVWLEVATTAEEFGDTLAQPSAERAEDAADASAAAKAAAEAAELAAQGAQAAAEAAELAAANASSSATADAAAAEASRLLAEAAQAAAEAAQAAASLSETNAGLSETAALAAQVAAELAETNAAASALAASTSEGNASTSETNAAASAVAAAASAAAALASQTAAALSEANINTAIAAEIGVTIQAYDATIVVDADIGVSVQAYNANTVVEDRSLTAEDNLIDFTKKNFELTATAANITATGLTGTFPREGTILVHSAENITGWGAEFKFKTVPTDLTGDETFGYFIEDALNIWIGRVQ